MKFASAAAMKEADNIAIHRRGISSIGLIRTAAEGIFRAAETFLAERPCTAVVFAGSGNNGADGVAAAQLLKKAGVSVTVYLTGSKTSPDSDILIREAKGMMIPVLPFDEPQAKRDCKAASVIIDAMFGIGLHSDLRGNALSAVQLINESCRPVIAADIPSGIHADTGKAMGAAVRADVTVTFSCAKSGLALEPGCEYSGEVQVWDIGLPRDLLEASCLPLDVTDIAYIKTHLPQRKAVSHKGDYGKLLILAGSEGLTGAPYLAALSAVRSGAGLVWLAVPRSIYPILAVKCTGSMPFPLAEEMGERLDQLAEKPCNVCLVGPGLGRQEQTQSLIRTLVEEKNVPMVVDADGINALQGHIHILDEAKGERVLTPHEGEFSRLCPGWQEKGRLQSALDFARAHHCVLLLKGHRTVIASPDGRAMVNPTGNAGMAKGGSGDVLSGLIASLMAQGAPAFEAAVMGAWIAGKAADLTAPRMSPYTMTPPDTVDDFSKVFNLL